jgi:hypothetical protein
MPTCKCRLFYIPGNPGHQALTETANVILGSPAVLRLNGIPELYCEQLIHRRLVAAARKSCNENQILIADITLETPDGVQP